MIGYIKLKKEERWHVPYLFRHRSIKPITTKKELEKLIIDYEKGINVYIKYHDKLFTAKYFYDNFKTAIIEGQKYIKTINILRRWKNEING